MKAIALISGGLDSTLAAQIVKDLGIELVAFNTVTPFCLCNKRDSSGCSHGASRVASDLGLRLISLNVTDEILEIIKSPKHGYGSNMNPCIDCRILLFKKAKQVMQEEGAAFVITGEVLGQRPMSQRLHTMSLIEKESGLSGLVVRPLCAKCLEPTFAEKEGWINREKLLGISGRGRKEQFSLAEEFGINDYPCPSGGCLLTDPEFAKRLKELIQHNEFNLENIKLLKIGRHFRLAKKAKLIVGRNEQENEQLKNLAKDNDYLFMPLDIAGPTALGRGEFNDELIGFSCGIVTRYCDLNGNINAKINYLRFNDGEGKVFLSQPSKEEDIVSLRI
ncbi:MAG: hypothetical protein AB1481_07060 [Candidatus Omnitrophota bacterium]